MSKDELRRSLEELFSEISLPEPEGEAEPAVPLPTPGEVPQEPPSPPAGEAAPPPPAPAPPGVKAEPVAPSEEPQVPPPAAPKLVVEEGVEEKEALKPLISARVTAVRDRLIGMSLVLLSLLSVAALLIFTSFSQLEETTATLQQERGWANLALEMEGAADDVLAALREAGEGRSAARLKELVGPEQEKLSEILDSAVSNMSALPSDDPMLGELSQLWGYVSQVRGLAEQVIQSAEKRDWEYVELYTQSDLIPYYGREVELARESVERRVEEREAAYLAVVEQARRNIRTIPLVWGALIAATALLTTVVTVRSIARPLERLTQATSRLAAGHLDERVRIEQVDEFGRLASAFNRMAESLQVLYNELEERVRERTQALQEANYALQRRAMQLEASAEVGRAITSIFDVDELLRRTVDLVRERFGFYHAGIFLMDETGQWAVLREATGEAGALMKARGHRLPVGETSMVGWTALHCQPRIALDVGEDAVHFANPLLPYTRSEMTLPLMVGDRLLGVLDVQSTEEAAFDEDDVRALQSMADQIAIAIENARRISEETALLEATSPIYRASRRLTTAMSVEEVVDVIVASVRETGVDGCIVALAEPYGSAEPEMFHFISSWRRDRESPIRPGARLPVSAAHMRLERMRTLWVVADVSSPGPLSEEEKAFFQRAGVEAIANIPLRVGDRMLGFVVAYRVTPGAFPEGALRLYEVLSGQASVALERVRLLEVTRQRAEMEARVRAIGDRLARAVDLEGVVRGATEELSQLLGAAGVRVELGTGVAAAEGRERGG